MVSLLGSALKNGMVERPKTSLRSDAPDSTLNPNVPDAASSAPIDQSAREASASQRALQAVRDKLLAAIPAGETRQLLSRYLDIMMQADQLQKQQALDPQAREALRVQAAQIRTALAGRDQHLAKRLENFGGHLFRCSALFAQASASDANPRAALQIDIQKERVLNDVEKIARIFQDRANDQKTAKAEGRAGRAGSRNSVSRHITGRLSREAYLPDSDITIDRAMVAIDAMVKAGFPIANREKSIEWISTFMAESGLDPRNVGDGNTSWGLGQVHYTAHKLSDYPSLNSWKDLFDPYKNMEVCASLSGGWTKIGPWHARSKRAQFEDAAEAAYDMYMQTRVAPK